MSFSFSFVTQLSIPVRVNLHNLLFFGVINVDAINGVDCIVSLQ